MSLDGWMRTGDVAKRDPDGSLYILDRAKDLIIRGGENISCAEVEAVLYEHPSVAEAAVFGLPDERLGEVVCVALVCKAGSTSPTDEQLLEHSSSRLAAFKVPKRIF